MKKEYFTRDELGRLVPVETIPEPAASSLPPPPPPAPPSTPPDDQIVLGTDASGRPVSLAELSQGGLETWERIVNPSRLGARAKEAFAEMQMEPLRARAVELGIDIAAVEKIAKATGCDLAATLKAEIELAELILKDRSGGKVRPW